MKNLSFKTNIKKITVLLSLFFIFSSCCDTIAQDRIGTNNLEINLNPKDGTIENIWIKNKKLPLKNAEAFIKVRDVKSENKFYPLLGKVVKKNGNYFIYGNIKELKLRARVSFTVRGNNIFISMDFVNGTQNNRGLIVSTMLNFRGNNYIWGGGLYNEVHPDEHKLYGNNRYPITTLKDTGNQWGVAAAIPPDAPVFYNTHFEDGVFGINYFIALTSKTLNFPNEAKLKEVIYSINPKWGFRSGLQNYYLDFPDYYHRRITKAGLWFNGRTYPYPEDIKFYEARGYNQINSNNYELFFKTLKNWKNTNPITKVKGVDIFPYTIVGQREIYDLSDTTLDYITNREFYKTNKIITSKSNYNKAMEILKNWNTDKIIRFQTAGNANGFRSVKELREMIYNSGLYNANGKYIVIARRFQRKCLTFPLDPNPELFRNSPKMTIAKYSLNFYIPQFLKAMPDIAGIYFDSMGRWADYLNYRQEDFKYAQYPLSIDIKGNPVIPNVISHYEYLRAARKYLHDRDKLVFANGVAFSDAKLPNGHDDYDAEKGTSRFFIAALCDLATCESGAKTLMKNMILYRTYMGSKPYAVVAYQHEPTSDMEKYFKRGLEMDVFTSMSCRKSDPTDAVNAKLLHDKYLPLMKLLYNAGWEPITGVKGSYGIYCERYGDSTKDNIYVAVFNDTNAAKHLSLTIDQNIFGYNITKFANIIGNKKEYPILNSMIKLNLEAEEIEILQAM